MSQTLALRLSYCKSNVYQIWKLCMRNDSYNAAMKDIAEIRRANFLKLLEEFRDSHCGGVERGAMAAFARYHDMAPSFVSQMKSGSRDIGEVLARQLETRSGKPVRWMDDKRHLIDMSDSGQVDFVDVALTLYRASPDHAKDALLKALRDIVEKQKKPK